MKKIIKLSDFGFTWDRREPVSAIVLHYISNTQSKNPFGIDAVYKVLEQYGFGYHYIVDRRGNVYSMIKEEHEAWHAGESEFMGEGNCNRFSIGVAFIASRKSGYTDEQLVSGAELCSKKELRGRYTIPLCRIVGHENIVPPGLRKNLPAGKKDPGPLFMWGKFFNFLLEHEKVFV